MTDNLNESEQLMRAVMGAVTKWHVDRGRVDGGKADVGPRQLLNVFAALAGGVLATAPAAKRQDATKAFITETATYSGFQAHVELEPMQ